MNKHEFIIIAINIAIILSAYFIIYSKHAGSNANKIALYDVGLSFLALFVAGIMFGGEGYVFNVVFISLNWFWFTLLTYFLLELPLTIWYYQRNHVFSKKDT